jgi:hypothetical protein
LKEGNSYSEKPKAKVVDPALVQSGALAYTFSKWMSNVPSADAAIGTTNSTGVQNYYDLAAENSLSEDDFPQSLIVNVVADLPFGRGKYLLSNVNPVIDKIIGGWNVSGILTEQSGFPLALHAPVAGGGNRPNLIPGVSPKLPGSRPLAAKVTEWFNAAAFAQLPAFTLGNVSRTIGSVRSPALKNLDLSFGKEAQIYGRLRFQFRAETFNLTNTPHFGLPNTTYSSTTFGQLNTLLPSPPTREIQFAAKLVF